MVADEEEGNVRVGVLYASESSCESLSLHPSGARVVVAEPFDPRIE